MNVLETVRARARVIVPVYPALIFITAIVPAKVASTVTSLVLVPSKTTVSPAAGQVSKFQFAHVLQLLSIPPPSQVLVAAKTEMA